MKFFFLLLFISTCLVSKAQYYYKDIVGTKETADNIKLYLANKVSRVLINSFDADGTKSDDFLVEQVFSPSSQMLVTRTRSGVTDESIMKSFINAEGQVVKIIDSTETLVSTTVYSYTPDGKLAAVNSIAEDSSKTMVQTEEHLWQYEGNAVSKMIRVKNKVDTSVVSFTTDKTTGQVTEEASIRRGVKSEPVYYYYDAQGRLTDIVRFNSKARRLLPEYMFEYSPANQIIQKITVPANGSNYLIWRYQYDSRGLKIKEAIYNKQKQLNGKIEYQYAFAN